MTICHWFSSGLYNSYNNKNSKSSYRLTSETNAWAATSTCLATTITLQQQKQKQTQNKKIILQSGNKRNWLHRPNHKNIWFYYNPNLIRHQDFFGTWSTCVIKPNESIFHDPIKRCPISITITISVTIWDKFSGGVSSLKMNFFGASWFKGVSGVLGIETKKKQE